MLLTKYKNQAYQTIIDQGYPIEKFEGTQSTEANGGTTVDKFTIRVKGSDVVFNFRVSPHNANAFDCTHSTVAHGWALSDPTPFVGYTEFRVIMEKLKFWLETVVATYFEEIGGTDFWAQARAESDFLNSSFSGKSGEGKFSSEEKALLRIALQQVRADIIREFAPMGSQLAQIDERLNHLDQSLDSLSKMDWKGIAVSTIISIATTLSLDTSHGVILVKIFKDAFSFTMHLLTTK